MNSGIYLLHKPAGPTSFTMVQTFRQSMAGTPGRARRLCHGGTLDPFAEGLLLLLAGPATRLMDLHHAIPKEYTATVRWGMETGTGDPGGVPVFRGDLAELDPPRLAEALAAFQGWQDQVPPATSAKKIGGEPAYKKVHRGETVQLPASRVYLHQAVWLSHQLPETSELRLVCRGGYYVRALVRDLGRRLGCGAHLERLHRTLIGPYADPGKGAPVPVPSPELLPWCPRRLLTDHELGELRQGKSIASGTCQPPRWNLPAGFPAPPLQTGAIHRDRLVAVLQPSDDRYAPALLLPGGL